MMPVRTKGAISKANKMGRLNTGACAQPAPSILLRDHGIPVTAQRLAVMRSVSAHPHGTSPRHIPTAHPHGTSPRHC
ncbi:MAG: hypothetical protein QNK61_12780 [Akkermansiaceae bacterium]